MLMDIFRTPKLQIQEDVGLLKKINANAARRDLVIVVGTNADRFLVDGLGDGILLESLNQDFDFLRTCAVCHYDLHAMKDELLFSSPCIVGHKITSEVVEHGALTDRNIVKRYEEFEKSYEQFLKMKPGNSATQGELSQNSVDKLFGSKDFTKALGN